MSNEVDERSSTSISTPSDTEIRIERVFEAPRELVWEAHADPDLLGEWLGPYDHPVTVESMDLQPGGSYRWTSPAPEGEELAFYGEYREVSPPEVMEMTFEFSGAPGHVSVDRLELEELEGGRTRLVSISTFDSKEDRDGMLQSGMETGMTEGYEKLDELVERLRSRS
ncbi:MAG: SRPBCC family protein [Actinomycetota bacterium]|nr:SRPBCC family protein [Actinomycetota bacterium]